MRSLPRHWSRLLVAAGLIVAVWSVPLWLTVHPAAGIAALVAGVGIVSSGPDPLRSRPRDWSRVLRFTGGAATVLSAILWFDASPLLALPLLIAGNAIVVLGVLLGSRATPTEHA